jgi:hypothetical protein
MTTRILGVLMLAALLAMTRPSPAAAQASFSLAIGVPGFGAAVSVPGAYYAPPPVYVPAPVYAPAPVYVVPPVYGGGVYYAPQWVHGPVYRPYHGWAHYGPRRVAHGYRRW